jgi:hypothetical protein
LYETFSIARIFPNFVDDGQEISVHAEMEGLAIHTAQDMRRSIGAIWLWPEKILIGYFRS